MQSDGTLMPRGRWKKHELESLNRKPNTPELFLLKVYVIGRIARQLRAQAPTLGLSQELSGWTCNWVIGLYEYVSGNERADELERKNAEKRFTGTEPVVELPMQPQSGNSIYIWKKNEYIRVLEGTPWTKAGKDTSWGLRSTLGSDGYSYRTLQA